MPELPIAAYRQALVTLVANNPVVVVSGETGCGKTTQIPQYLYDAPEIRRLVWLWHSRPGRRAAQEEPSKRPRLEGGSRSAESKSQTEEDPRIVIVQPHRIAAIAMARRVADERGVVLGKEVGYSVRWDTMTDPKETRIKYVTDGTLVKECVDGRGLSKMDIVIIDEAHERSLHIDVLLALIKRHLSTTYGDKRRYPRVDDIPIRFIITSATLDVEKFCKFFNDCPLLTVPGRVYPVKIIHVPVRVTAENEEADSADEQVGGITVPSVTTNEGKSDGLVYNPARARQKRRENSQIWLSPDAAVSAAVTISLRIHCETPVLTGHILCFLSGAAECERAVKMMHAKLQEVVSQQENETGVAASVASAVVIPLYGSLDAQQQANVFIQVDDETRKIVFATNVAETSLTISGVGHIVDSGIVKQTYYHPRSGMVALNRVPVSKTQANQRAGRAGRTKDGTCWRLYGEDTYNQMEEHAVPEILRSDPSAAVLSLLAMNIRNVLALEFIDTPNKLSVALALKELATLGAIEPTSLEVTAIGRAISQTPLDPVYGRCFVASLEFDVVEEVATILALLSAEQIFTSPNLAAMVESPDEPLPTLFNIFRHKHSKFRDFDSDHLTLLNIFHEWKKRRGGDVKMMRKDELYDWCWDNYISMRALLTAEKIQKQLIDLMPEIEELVGPIPSHRLEKVLQMRRKERVLRALCEGLFVNTAKLHIVKSMTRGPIARGWTSARDGVVLRPAPQSALSEFIESPDIAAQAPPLKRDPPSWIIYDQLVSIGSAPGTSQASGVVRVASGIEYDWVAPLMPRMYQTSLDELIEAVQAPPARARRSAPGLSDWSRDVTLPVRGGDTTDIPETTEAERRRKLEEAKKRLEERKRKQER